MFILKSLYHMLMIVYTGFTVMCLWGWFVAPTFGLTPLSLLQAIGLDLSVTFLTTNSTGFYLGITMEYLVKEFPRLKTVQEKVTSSMTWFASPMLTSWFLAMGAIVHYLTPFFT